MSIHKRRGRLQISPGFVLLLSGVYYLSDGSGAALWASAAAALHEIGHIGAALLMGGQLECLRLSVVGAELKFRYQSILTYRGEVLIALTGPTCNLAAGLLLMWAGFYFPAAISFGLGLFNLLPIYPLDGGRVLCAVVSACCGPARAELITDISSAVLVGFILGSGIVVAANYANWLLLVLAAWLLLGALNKQKIC